MGLNLTPPTVNIDELTIELYRMASMGEIPLLSTGRDTPRCYTLLNGPKLRMASFIPEDEVSPLMYGRFHKYEHYIREFLWDVKGGQNVNDLGPSKFLWDTWANKDGTIPFSYGASWRNFAGDLLLPWEGIDQLEQFADNIAYNPYGRRHVIITYDPANPYYDSVSDKDIYAIPPCHTQLIFNYDGEYLHITVIGRSQDVVTGLPGDLFRYSLFLLTVCHITQLKPGNVYMDNCNIHFYDKDYDLMREIWLRQAKTRELRSTLMGSIYIDKEHSEIESFDNYELEHYHVVDYPDKPTGGIPFMKIPGGVIP